LIEEFRRLHAHVLIEGTGPGDLNFVVRWLLSAAKADRLLAREFTNDPQFRASIDRQEVSTFVEFRSPAMAFLRTHPTSAVLSEAWYFAKRVTLSLALRSSADAGRGFGRVGAAAALVA
jgi:hypothetical protein